MANLLEVKELSVAFDTPAGPIQALDRFSFRIKPQSSVALVGESGSGKSVCAQAIMGLLPSIARITGGEILFRDQHRGAGIVDLAKLSARSRAYRALRGGRISIIFQEPMTSLSPLHTVGNQVTEALMLHESLERAAAEARCLDMLRLVRFPDPARTFRSYPFELSGGLRQRAMIAMALICRPALLIADEPTTALDVTVQAQILGLIRDMQAELGMAVLMITHDMGVVANVAEEVVVAYRGQVMESGPAEALFRDPRHPYLRALLRAVPRIDADPDERLVPLVEEVAAAEAAGASVAGGPAGAPRTGAEAAGKPILQLQKVTKTYRIRRDGKLAGGAGDTELTAVDALDLTVLRGECLALVGESGCGKTTAAKMIMGAVSADSGQILFDDRGREIDLARLSDRQLVPLRPRIQYVFQDPVGSLNPRMTVLELLTEPLAIHGVGDRPSRRRRAAELMQRVGIDPRHLNRYPHSFSGGQRQRIGIGRALMLGPELLICDEPVSALDVSTRAQVLNLLKDLKRELALTMLFISHDLAVVNYIADRVAVMCRGRLVEVAPRAELFGNPQHPYTRALLASVPEPDPDRKLDFAGIASGRMTEPADWPPPFGPADGRPMPLVDIGGGHLVRAAGRPEAKAAAHAEAVA
ncbi:MAG: ABC transporter ATP-binding protein [Hyphomicrobiaceae bacterium]